MKRPAISTVLLCFTVSLLFQNCTGIAHIYPPEKSPLYLSPLAIAADCEGDLLYIAEATADRVAVFDRGDGSVVGVVRVPSHPSGLVLSADGSILFVTRSVPEGTVEIINTARRKIVGSVRVGHSPCSPVVSPDGASLYVCNRFDNSLSVVDLKSLKETRKVSMLREPIAAGITPDGRYLFVANHIPSGRRIAEYISDGGIYMIGGYYSSGYFNTDREAYSFACVILVYDTVYNRIVELIKLPNGSTGIRGLSVSPDGSHVYVTHVLARYLLPTTSVERGLMNTNALSIIDAKKLKYMNTVLLDDPECGAANPWGVVCTENGKYICVAHTGTHEISIIDRQGLHDRLDNVSQGIKTPAASSKSEDVINDLTFLAGLRQRIELTGKGPRGVAAVGSRIYIAEYFSDTLGIVDIGDESRIRAESILLGPAHPLTPERKGEMYFNDGDLCFQTWQSCASCHPDGRADGLNWDLLNDGIGNPKNTKSLLLSHITPPVMVTGVRSTAEEAVRSGIKNILFTPVQEEAASAVDSYLRSLKPVPSPYLERGKLTGSARRGRKIFKQAGCAECHPAPLFTDMKKYSVGTGIGREMTTEFDTPSLVEAWRTGSYLYDGRADTMDDVLKKFNTGDRHGVTSDLKGDELNDLIEYIMSL